MMRCLRLHLQLASLLQQMKKRYLSKSWRLRVNPDLAVPWLLKAFRRAGYEAYFYQHDDYLRIRIIAPLAVDDYDFLANSRGIRWIGLTVPRNTTDKTTWRCRQGHKWRASYRTIERGYGWTRPNRTYLTAYCPTCLKSHRRSVKR